MSTPRIDYERGLEEYQRERAERLANQAPIIWRTNGREVRLRLTEEWFAATPPIIREGPFAGLMGGSIRELSEMHFEEHFKATAGSFRAKEELQRKYAWAIPAPRALEVLAFHAPLIEVGAGTGYWASLLREGGYDVLAFDSDPPTPNGTKNNWHYQTAAWTPVKRAGAEVAGKHPERTLFLCWPPYDTPMGSTAVQSYLDAGGQRVVFIGEGRCGCTGDDRMFTLFDTFFETVTAVSLPQWWGLHDYMEVYHRNDVPLSVLPREEQ